MGRDIKSISYALTTHCNMRCPDCCAGITAMEMKHKKFYDWEYLALSAKYFKGIDRVSFTGGEPSVHPKFSEWAGKFKELFGCRILSIWTNGTMFRKKTEAWAHFDEIHISNYTKESFEGSPDNTADIEFIKSVYPKKYISAAKVVHEPLTKRGTKMCFRGLSDTVEFVDGFIYPCCAGSGLETKVRLPLCDNWKTEILKLHPPCGECLFAEP